MWVNDNDFRRQVLDRAVPYGIHDMHPNRAPSLSETPATSQFRSGLYYRLVYCGRMDALPECRPARDSSRMRSIQKQSFKGLEVLDANKSCDPHQLQVTVAHYPSGSSRWNPIQHRLFSLFTRNWSGRPLDSWETIINFVCTTTNQSGLTVKGIRVTKIIKLE